MEPLADWIAPNRTDQHGVRRKVRAPLPVDRTAGAARTSERAFCGFPSGLLRATDTHDRDRVRTHVSPVENQSTMQQWRRARTQDLQNNLRGQRAQSKSVFSLIEMLAWWDVQANVLLVVHLGAPFCRSSADASSLRLKGRPFL
jgi:hypothetical protein